MYRPLAPCGPLRSSTPLMRIELSEMVTFNGPAAMHNPTSSALRMAATRETLIGLTKSSSAGVGDTERCLHFVLPDLSFNLSSDWTAVRSPLLDRFCITIHSSTPVASISIKKSGTARADTPIQVLAGRFSSGKNSRSAPAIASACSRL